MPAFSQGCPWDFHGQQLKGQYIQGDPEAMGQGPVKGTLQIRAAFIKDPFHLHTFLSDPFQMQFMKPAAEVLEGDVPQVIGACQPAITSPEDLISLVQVCGKFRNQGLDPPTKAIVCIGIVISRHMKDYIVVGGIQVVLMPVPIRGNAVYFHISSPDQVSHPDPGIQEIGSPVRILLPGEQYFEFFP
jgi:hypothetical protein